MNEYTIADEGGMILCCDNTYGVGQLDIKIQVPKAGFYSVTIESDISPIPGSRATVLADLNADLIE